TVLCSSVVSVIRPSTTPTCTLSLHDALPIYGLEGTGGWMDSIGLSPGIVMAFLAGAAEFFGGIALILGLLTRPAALSLAIAMVRSEDHTSELQSRENLVCRLLLEKKKRNTNG